MRMLAANPLTRGDPRLFRHAVETAAGLACRAGLIGRSAIPGLICAFPHLTECESSCRTGIFVSPCPLTKLSYPDSDTNATERKRFSKCKMN